MKICPVCKSRCFDDMNTCYGCLHHFEENAFVDDHMQEVDEIEDVLEECVFASTSIPEYFEIDSCPIIEDKTASVLYKQNEESEKFTIKIELPKSILSKYVV